MLGCTGPAVRVFFDETDMGCLSKRRQERFQTRHDGLAWKSQEDNESLREHARGNRVEAFEWPEKDDTQATVASMAARRGLHDIELPTKSSIVSACTCFELIGCHARPLSVLHNTVP